MELQRLCKRISNMNSSVERAYVKDISTIIDDIFFEYDIFYKDTNQNVSKEILLHKFLNIFGNSDEIKMCIGISQNGNKCCKRAQNKSDYCKTHKYLEFRQKTNDNFTLQNDNLFLIEESVKNADNINIKNMKKQLIDGTIYYTDSSFVYDIDSLERVGYVDNEKCILTDDPFILCM
jgi:hypothetical protein